MIPASLQRTRKVIEKEKLHSFISKKPQKNLGKVISSVVRENEVSFSTIVRSSRSQMFFKISVLKNFTNFTEKHLFWSLFPSCLELYQKETPAQVFFCEVCKIFKNIHLRTTKVGLIFIEMPEIGTFCVNDCHLSASLTFFSIWSVVIRANTTRVFIINLFYSSVVLIL